jgi:hypothetical protein
MTVGEAYLIVLAFLVVIGLSVFFLTRRHGNRVVATANALLAFVVSAVGIFGLAIPNRHSDQYCPVVHQEGAFPTLSGPFHYNCRYDDAAGQPIDISYFSLLPLAWIVICSVVILGPVGWTLLINRRIAKRRRTAAIALTT